jgi:hypothetical protein
LSKRNQYIKKFVQGALRVLLGATVFASNTSEGYFAELLFFEPQDISRMLLTSFTKRVIIIIIE